MLLAAGLLASKARERGLAPPPWVKTSLAPGSPAAADYLRRSGLLADLEALGFGIVGFGCTTCIGNSGPLVPAMAEAIRERGVVAAAVLSGNRNFPGRVHGMLDHAFLASPPLVIAYGLAGRVDLDISREPIGRGHDGTAVFLADIWPTDDEITTALASAVRPADFIAAFADLTGGPAWAALEAPVGPRFPWDGNSTYLRRPPFVALPARPAGVQELSAVPLIVLGDDITTDHISPAGAIPAKGEAGKWLIEAGEDPKTSMSSRPAAAISRPWYAACSPTARSAICFAPRPRRAGPSMRRRASRCPCTARPSAIAPRACRQSSSPGGITARGHRVIGPPRVRLSWARGRCWPTASSGFTGPT